MSTDAVTYWVEQLKAANPAAVEPLWELCFVQLVRMAEGRLRAATRRAVGGEDVALSAFDSFCRAAQDGRLAHLRDRDSLWSHLFNYVRRKAGKWNRREHAEKRGEGAVVTASALDGPDGEPFLAGVLGLGPPPDVLAAFEEQCRDLFDRLTPELRTVALWKLDGLTHDEIAVKLGRDRRTVERKLSLIRGCWKWEDDT